MEIKYMIENLRDALNDNRVQPDNYYDFFNAILDMFQNISAEIDEINEMIQFHR